MTKVVYTNIDQYGDIKDLYQPNNGFALEVDGDGKTANFFDSIYFNAIGMVGKGMEEGTGAQENQFISGTVTKLTFDFYADSFATMTGHFKAVDLSKAEAKGGPEAVIDLLFSGKDTLIGSKAGDYMNGLGGDGDKLTGNGGADYFLIDKGNKADIVTDFDFKGKDHDWIEIEAGKHARVSTDKHGDVVITVGSDSLTLQGVGEKQFHDNFIVNADAPDMMF